MYFDKGGLLQSHYHSFDAHGGLTAHMMVTGKQHIVPWLGIIIVHKLPFAGQGFMYWHHDGLNAHVGLSQFSHSKAKNIYYPHLLSENRGTIPCQPHSGHNVSHTIMQQRSFSFFFPRGCGGVPQEDGMTILPLLILIKKGFYKLMRIREAFKMSEHDWVRGSS